MLASTTDMAAQSVKSFRFDYDIPLAIAASVTFNQLSLTFYQSIENAYCFHGFGLSLLEDLTNASTVLSYSFMF